MAKFGEARSGALRRRLTIERALYTPDGVGGFVVSWTSVGAAWASMRLQRGAAVDRGERQGLDTVWAIRMRWRNDLDGACRLRHGALVLSIMSRGDPDGRGCWLAITAREETP